MIIMMLLMVMVILLCIIIGLVMAMVGIGVIFHSGVGIFFYYSPLIIIIVRSIDGVGRVGGWKVVDDASTSGCSMVIIICSIISIGRYHYCLYICILCLNLNIDEIYLISVTRVLSISVVSHMRHVVNSLARPTAVSLN